MQTMDPKDKLSKQLREAQIEKERLSHMYSDKVTTLVAELAETQPVCK